MNEQQSWCWPQAVSTRSFSSTPDVERSESKDTRIVFHELGHAVVGLALGDSLESITVDAFKASDGELINGRVRWIQPASEDIRDRFEHRFDRCTVIVAGAVAERLFTGETRGLRGSDLAKARMHAGLICQTERGIDHILRAAEAEAEDFLIERSHLVMMLAERLRVCRTMTGAQVEQVVSDIEATKLAASWKNSGYLGPDTIADIRARMQVRQNMIERFGAD
jgi:hypothetical protein